MADLDAHEHSYIKHRVGTDAKQKKGRGMGKEKPVIDASTMSLKAIIKVAYAQERLRMEEERKRRVFTSALASALGFP